MMASKLIEALQAAIKEHGDYHVAVKELGTAGSYRILDTPTLEPEMIGARGGPELKGMRVFCL